jgi:hypothetical protein
MGPNGTCRRVLGAASKWVIAQMNDNDTPLVWGNDTPPLVHKPQRIVTQSAEGTQAFVVDGERGRLRAADADRNRVVEILNTAYIEGRLSKDEYDGRLENALSARTYADLDVLVRDLPAAQATMVPPVTKTNALAIASLACGLGQFAFGPMATIPAIVFGHMAQHQIKRTGEQGAGLALAGLVLGWGAVILAVFFVAVVTIFVGRNGGTVPTH